MFVWKSVKYAYRKQKAWLTNNNIYCYLCVYQTVMKLMYLLDCESIGHYASKKIAQTN